MPSLGAAVCQFAWLCSAAPSPHTPKQKAVSAADAAGDDSALPCQGLPGHQHLDPASETEPAAHSSAPGNGHGRWFVISLGGSGERGKKRGIQVDRNLEMFIHSKAMELQPAQDHLLHKPPKAVLQFASGCVSFPINVH